jgi:ABC-type branched-subunit amino acid transport system substrate-binding protein
MRSRRATLTVALALTLAACGARLTPEQRLAGIGGVGGGAGGGATSGTESGGGPSPEATATTPSGGGGGGPAGGGSGTGGPGGGGAACSTNPGATDVGVTAREIVIATASDVSGVQAALFKSTHEAIRAFAAYVNSQGGICGRLLRPLLLDSRATANDNQAAVKEACDKAFALVGSMSAFDNGGAQTGAQCGIPDLSAITVNGDRALAPNVYPAYPVRPDKFAIGTANYIKEKFPGVIQSAGIVYLDAAVTKSNALQRKRAYETVGFRFREYVAGVVEPNYASIVQRMKNDGIRYVTMVANFQSIQALLDAMDKANWYPEVRDWDSVAYSPAFVTRNNQPFAPANGSLVFLNANIVEEAASNPEMQRYIQWLRRVAPGAKPDYFGLYAWSAGLLFLQAAQAVGPRLTRAAFLGEVRKIHSWTGNGIHAAHDVGNKVMSPCFLYLEIRGGRFVRKDPASGFICDKGGIINT